MKYLYHIAKNKDWKNAQKTGLYIVGSLHRSFDEDGFIHLSYAPQLNVDAVINVSPYELTADDKFPIVSLEQFFLFARGSSTGL